MKFVFPILAGLAAVALIAAALPSSRAPSASPEQKVAP